MAQQLQIRNSTADKVEGSTWHERKEHSMHISLKYNIFSDIIAF